MEWRDGYLILCLTGMLFQLDIIPCTDDWSIVTYVLQMGRCKMIYDSFNKILINDIDHSITYAYIYPLIRMQETFSLDKLTQLDLIYWIKFHY